MVGKFGNCCCYKYGNNGIELFICIRTQMQRSCFGDRQPPRGGGADLGKEIMKAEQYPTMGKVMELIGGWTGDQRGGPGPLWSILIGKQGTRLCRCLTCMMGMIHAPTMKSETLLQLFLDML